MSWWLASSSILQAFCKIRDYLVTPIGLGKLRNRPFSQFGQVKLPGNLEYSISHENAVRRSVSIPRTILRQRKAKWQSYATAKGSSMSLGIYQTILLFRKLYSPSTRSSVKKRTFLVPKGEECGRLKCFNVRNTPLKIATRR